MKNKFLKKLNFLLIAIVFSLPFFAYASEISFESDKTKFSKNEEWLLNVNMLPSGKEKINAVEGQITIPQSLIDVVEIRNGNSSVAFWVSQPKYENGVISFSGVTPDSFQYKKNFLFSVVLKTKKAGSGNIVLNEEKVLLNDGLGTATKVKKGSLSFSVSDESLPSTISKIDDSEPPEIFVPHIDNDESIFGGKYFVVFSTQDKKSGIAGYAVKEGSWGDFKEATSPYLLTDQGLTKKIYVKATDVAGNERVVELKPTNKPWYLDYRILVIILVIICVVFLLKKWRRIFS